MATQTNFKKLSTDGLVFYVDGLNEKTTPQPIPPETDRASRAADFDINVAGTFLENSTIVDAIKTNTVGTFTYWYYMTSIPNSGKDIFQFSSGDGSANFRMGNHPTNLCHNMSMQSPAGAYLINYYTAPGQPLLVSGSWEFYSVVYDGSNIITYKNGSFHSTFSDPGNWFNSLGTYTPGQTARMGFHGLVDNFTYHSRVLSPAEITALWNGGSGTRYSDLTDSLKTDLELWLPMNEASGTRYDVHGGHHFDDTGSIATTSDEGKVLEYYVNDFIGDVQGTPTPSITLENGVYEFDGVDDWVNFGNAFDFANTSFTIDLWMNASLDAGLDDPFYKSGQILIRYSTTTKLMGFGHFDNGVTYKNMSATAADQIVPNTWENYTFVWDNTQPFADIKSMYKNGVLIPTTGGIPAASLASNTNNIQWSINTGTNFSGKMSQLKIYNKALTAEEIQNNYNIFKKRFGH